MWRCRPFTLRSAQGASQSSEALCEAGVVTHIIEGLATAGAESKMVVIDPTPTFGRAGRT